MSIRIYGATSGYVDLDAPAVAGSASVTLPGSGTLALYSQLKVLQVVSTTKTDTWTTTALGWSDVTGLSASITPSSATSKILVIATVTGAHDVGSNQHYVKVLRGSTDIAIGDAASNRIRAGASLIASNNANGNVSAVVTHLDSPATTSATTYKVQSFNSVSGKKVSVNASTTDADDAFTVRSVSTITLVEVAA